jgi:PAS domain S-box-containing protein
VTDDNAVLDNAVSKSESQQAVFKSGGIEVTIAEHRVLSLHSRAQTILQRAPLDADAPASGVRQLIDELLLHQSELNAQNEQLRATQLELEAARARCRELFDLAPVACINMTGEAEIIEANKAAAMLLGQRPQTLIGKKLSALLAPEHAERLEHHRRAVMRSDCRVSCDVDLAPDDRGERRELRLESMRAGCAGQPYWRCALIDVTEVHKLQRQLQHTLKLEAIGSLASEIAHDVGNLLMAIVGGADIALERMESGHPARTAIEELRRGALHGRSAVAQLLTFARKNAPCTDLLELNAALNEHAPLLGRLLGCDIELELDLSAPDPSIALDAAQLEQILLNLATNARHAMPSGGRVRIATRLLAPEALGSEVRAELGPRACVMLEVSDTGRGMDDRIRARAFEPFFTTKPPGAGTGLGLSMVYGAVRQSGGHCELRSRIGEGTAVRIYWPRAGAAQDRARSGTFPIVQLPSAPRVLLIDDDRLVRLAIRHYLEHGGYRVLECESGERALEALRTDREALSLLLSDVVLPGMKGPEIVAAARALQPALPVLLVSAHPPEVLIERGWLPPGLRLLRKPFTSEELLSAVRSQLPARADVVTTRSAGVKYA